MKTRHPEPKSQMNMASQKIKKEVEREGSRKREREREREREKKREKKREKDLRGLLLWSKCPLKIRAEKKYFQKSIKSFHAV